MKTKLILLRGNSGSGKTTLAHDLNAKLPGTKLLISLDVVRREMLFVKDEPNNLSIDLIQQMAIYGKNRVDYVILEGIFVKKIYGTMLTELIQLFDEQVIICYFNLSFQETLKRHHTKKEITEFGEVELRRWFRENDELGVPNEIIFTGDMSLEQTFHLIFP